MVLADEEYQEAAAKERVARGVLLLDKYVPSWAGKIDLAFLDMGNCAHCVLGQVFGSYFSGYMALGDQVAAGGDVWSGTFDAGFDLNRWSDESQSGYYSLLNKQWRIIIAERQKSAGGTS